MFNNLSERLGQPLNALRGTKKLTENNIKDTLDEVRKALIEADVALPVIKQFIAEINDKAVGKKITSKVRAGDAFVKIVSDELTQLLGESNSELNLNAQPPVVILMAGLQGSGKTTTVAKLAKHLQDKHIITLTHF